MKQLQQLHKGFTLVEVLVTIAMSSVLFIAVSNLMVGFFRLNTGVTNDIALNNEKEGTFLTINNYLNQANRMISSSSPYIFINKKESRLLPLTIITTADSGQKYKNDTTINKLLIKNISLDNGIFNYSPIKTGSGYTIDYFNNQVIKGENPTTFCKIPTDDNCILAGYKNDELAIGDTLFAPFVTITKPTDLVINGNKVQILSPYEGREYVIDTTTLQITTNIPTVICPAPADGKAHPLKFPLYYDGTNPVDLVKTCTNIWELTSSIVPTPIINAPAYDTMGHYGMDTFTITKDVYHQDGSSYHLDKIDYTLIDPMYNDSGESMNDTPYDIPANGATPAIQGKGRTTGFLIKPFLW